MERELATHREDLPHAFALPSTLQAAVSGTVLCETCGKHEDDQLHRSELADRVRERANYMVLETEKGTI